MIIKKLLDLLFPPKCVLCQRLLSDSQTDLCHSCRVNTEEFRKPKHKISFVAGWTALWYYRGDVRHSLLLYKFHGRRSYAQVYGRLLAMKLLKEPPGAYDLITWVPVSRQRRRKRGYDQVELIACAAGRELGKAPLCTMKKLHHNRPQSRLADYSARKANVMGAFAVTDPQLIDGKRILLLDDIITTGATASECARVLLTAGAKEVYCAAVAALNKDKRR